MATVSLDAHVSGLKASLSEEALKNRGKEAEAVIVVLGLLVVAVSLSLVHEVGHEGRVVDHTATTLGDTLLKEKHLADGGVHDDGVSSLLRELGASEGAHGKAVLCVCERELVGTLSSSETLDSGTNTGGVDKGEHLAHTLVGHTKELTLSVLKNKLTSRGAVATHLVLDTAHSGTVELVSQGSVVIDLELGYSKEGDTLDAGGCIRETRENTVYNVVHHVVLTAGDENLSTGDLVLAVVGGDGLGGNLGKIRTTVGLSEAHGTGPLAANELLEVLALYKVITMGQEGVDGTLGEAGKHGPGPVGSGGDLTLKEGERGGEALAAPLLREAESLPSTFNKGLVCLFESRRGLDGVRALLLASNAVGRFVARVQFVLSKASRLLKNHVYHVGGGALASSLGHLLVVLLRATHLVELEFHVAQGCCVRHGASAMNLHYALAAAPHHAYTLHHFPAFSKVHYLRDRFNQMPSFKIYF
mmetsp:Transcript_8333/g.14834  ORF Transcript_8333/g.14834 Transcript_8333/m.14834 type:complete len:473 (-) Transcript_8333:23-1441(-)